MENNEMNNSNEDLNINSQSSNVSMPTNKGNGGLKAIIVILIIAVLGLSAYLVYDKVISKNKTDNKTKTEENNKPTPSEESKTSVEVKDNMLYVNGNKVDLYSNSEFKESFTSEQEFYSTCGNEKLIFSYKAGNGFVFVNVAPCNILGNENYLIGEDGKNIKKINGKNSDIVLSFDNPYFSVESIDNNVISFKVGKYTQDPKGFACEKINENEGQNSFMCIDKITYKNGTFELEKGINKISYQEYVDQNNIKCDLMNTDFISEKIINPSDECSVCLISKYVSSINLNKYGNVYMNKKNGENQKIGENIIDVELFSYGNGGFQTIIMLQQNGTITAVDANDSEDIRILKNFGNLTDIIKIDNYTAIDKNEKEYILTKYVLEQFKSTVVDNNER